VFGAFQMHHTESALGWSHLIGLDYSFEEYTFISNINTKRCHVRMRIWFDLWWQELKSGTFVAAIDEPHALLQHSIVNELQQAPWR